MADFKEAEDVGKEGEIEGGEEKVPSFDWMPEGCVPMADGEYDAIIMGTGLTECILAGLLSVQGLRVLHVDRNNYYGAETASLSLTNLFQKFRNCNAPTDVLGHNRHWNVDLVPKFIMAGGNLVKILLHTKVTRYLEFKAVDGSYVYKDSKVQKVPSTPAEILSSSLMGFFEKRKFRNFMLFLMAYDKEKPSTLFKGKTLDRVTMRQLYDEYSLDDNTRAFTGHAMALHRDDDYIDQPALPTVEAILLYVDSCERLNFKSPYYYPLYGLGGLPESFSRLCAIHRGTFMLNKGVDEVLFDDSGRAWGIKTGNEVAKAKILLGDPSYFPAQMTRPCGRVVRSICILDHPITGTDNAESVQIIIPAVQVRRHNDIYVCMVSHAHNVAAPGKYIAIVSTTVETNSPNVVAELQPGIALLGRILERFDSVTDLVVPVEDGTSTNCFISKSHDATSHFETCADDVLDLYYRITGNRLDMNISVDDTEDN